MSGCFQRISSGLSKKKQQRLLSYQEETERQEDSECMNNWLTQIQDFLKFVMRFDTMESAAVLKHVWLCVNYM